MRIVQTKPFIKEVIQKEKMGKTGKRCIENGGS